ncbi:hypothetical protein Tco_0763656 [Tanacetum coccineum]
MTSDIDSCCVALEIGKVVECEHRSPLQPPRAIKCYAIVKAIDFDTGFASFMLGDNPILSSMPPISSLPPLMVCGVGDRLVASLSLSLKGTTRDAQRAISDSMKRKLKPDANSDVFERYSYLCARNVSARRRVKKSGKKVQRKQLDVRTKLLKF